MNNNKIIQSKFVYLFEYLNELSNIFIAGNLKNIKEGYHTLDSRFVYQNEKYATPKAVSEGIKGETNAITFGRYFSENEEENGEKVEVVYLNNALIFPELNLPDTDSITIYKNIIFISAIMCIISIFNFAMIYKFIFEQRKKENCRI